MSVTLVWHYKLFEIMSLQCSEMKVNAIEWYLQLHFFLNVFCCLCDLIYIFWQLDCPWGKRQHSIYDKVCWINEINIGKTKCNNRIYGPKNIFFPGKDEPFFIYLYFFTFIQDQNLDQEAFSKVFCFLNIYCRIIVWFICYLSDDKF